MDGIDSVFAVNKTRERALFEVYAIKRLTGRISITHRTPTAPEPK